MTDATSDPSNRRRRGSRFHGQGRPSKGDRVDLAADFPRPVWQWIDNTKTAYSTSWSQVVADVVAIRSGHPDLALVLTHERAESLPLMVVNTSTGAISDDDVPAGPVKVKTRLPRAAWDWVDEMAITRNTTLRQVVADVLAAAAGYHQLVRYDYDDEVSADNEVEGLPLAI